MRGVVDADLASRIWNGSYPEPALAPAKRDLWMSSYLQTYVERDIRQLAQVQDLRVFESVLGLAAARHGQQLNATEMARAVGVSQPTVRSWLALLEASYVLRQLPPFFENFGKRLVKAPKLYFVDTGLACTLTRQPSGPAALTGGMGGALFEGWVISEAWKICAARGQRGDLFFWRSHDGLEVDLLLQLPGRLVPIEIKLTATPTLRHTEALSRFQALASGEAAGGGILVCNVTEERPLPGGHRALPWQDFPGWLDRALAGD
jgi:predicted AAA+ superfamily ATPase